MTKLLIILLIVLTAFWLGKMSVSRKRTVAKARKKRLEGSVIDVKLKDE